jgi:hypothetical protein
MEFEPDVAERGTVFLLSKWDLPEVGLKAMPLEILPSQKRGLGVGDIE